MRAETPGEENRARSEPQPVTVGVLADPDLPLRLAQHLGTALPAELRARGGEDNVGTLTTVAVGAGAFFVTLYLLALGAVVLAIPPDYLAKLLTHPVGPREYLTIALTATLLGTIAGAVGSGLEDDGTVRKAAYGHRELERRRRAEQLNHRPGDRRRW